MGEMCRISMDLSLFLFEMNIIQGLKIQNSVINNCRFLLKYYISINYKGDIFG